MKLFFKYIAGKGSRQHDFCTTERAIFDSSRFEVGEKLLSSQSVVEISSEEKKLGISEGGGILLIWVTLSSKKVANVLTSSSADELVGKLFSAFLWRRRSIKRNRALLSLPACKIRLE